MPSRRSPEAKRTWEFRFRGSQEMTIAGALVHSPDGHGRATSHATTRRIITGLNAWRAAGLVGYDTDRASPTMCDVAGLGRIVDPDR
jgi:hypothetical protein